MSITSLFPGLSSFSSTPSQQQYWIPSNLGGSCSVSNLFAILCSSWGSPSKNTGVVWHSPPTVDLVLSELFTMTRLYWWPYTKWLVASLSHASPFSTRGGHPWREYSIAVNHYCFLSTTRVKGHQYLDLGELRVVVTCIRGACSFQWALTGNVPSALFYLPCHSCRISGAPSLPRPQEPTRGLQSGLGLPHLSRPLYTFFLVSCLFE